MPGGIQGRIEAMKDTYENRVAIWNFFIERWIVTGHGGGNGVTGRKLKAIKASILSDDIFWRDIISRHAGNHETILDIARDIDWDYFSHMLGNFWAMVNQRQRDMKLIK